MNCKFCNAELEEGITLCPACGQENLEEMIEPAAEELTPEMAQEITEEELEEAAMAAVEEPTEEAAAPAKQYPAWMKILAVVGAVALAAVLGVAVFFGIKAGGNIAKSYTVSEQKAVKEMNTVVATVGDLELTNNALQVYYFQAVDEFYSAYGSYLDSSVLDLNKPLDEQYYDANAGMTWQQYFLESALNSWSRYAALNMLAEENGFQLSQEVQDYLQDVPAQLDEMAIGGGYESAEAMLKQDMSYGCDMDGYMDFMKTNIYAGQYLESIYDTILPSDQEVADYYAANEALLNQQGIIKDGSVTVDARHIVICPEDDSEEAWEQCRVKAQELLDQWLDEDGTEEGFARYAALNTEDPGSMATGGLYTGIYVGQMVEPFEDWCFDDSRQPGDSGLVKTDYGYHIMYFVASHEVWISNVRDAMVYERSLEIVNGAVEKWPADVKNKKIALSSSIGTAEE